MARPAMTCLTGRSEARNIQPPPCDQACHDGAGQLVAYATSSCMVFS